MSSIRASTQYFLIFQFYFKGQTLVAATPIFLPNTIRLFPRDGRGRCKTIISAVRQC
ncbi:hypothetical protein B4099_1173 [Heyndrickxia coagulans]|uniref:Uncharacterized protein n=1 Tax=Heyndrickxia coagulans TaxID=1398 RepID=A0A150KGM9_HEYCO|nr:hypothetical protein B4099_1173 [Heyndrickxia coagulans]